MGSKVNGLEDDLPVALNNPRGAAPVAFLENITILSTNQPFPQESSEHPICPNFHVLQK